MDKIEEITTTIEEAELIEELVEHIEDYIGCEIEKGFGKDRRLLVYLYIVNLIKLRSENIGIITNIDDLRKK